MSDNSSLEMDTLPEEVTKHKMAFKRSEVTYIYDIQLSKCTDKITQISGRSAMVHELIKSYGLLSLMDCQPSRPATKEDLLTFHSKDYVEYLFQGVGTGQNDSQNRYGMSSNGSFDQEELEEFGLGYDCPVFNNLGEFALRIAGGTITAADSLLNGKMKIAINWFGGWHHAQRGEASGFCYVNDIVLGIHHLQKKFKRILYIDLDAHHGDGVENAFAYSNKVFTLSFHHLEPGFFPGTGDMKDIGKGRGKYFALNVPLKAGVVDHQFQFLFDSVINGVTRQFEPDAMVVQCGADCLAKDPLGGGFNLTCKGVVHCVTTILKLGKCREEDHFIPTMLLGGGGYNPANAARLWTSVTAEVLNKSLNIDIPENNNKYFLSYGPDFELEVQKSLRGNDNEDEYINQLIEGVMTGFLPALRKQREADG